MQSRMKMLANLRNSGDTLFGEGQFLNKATAVKIGVQTIGFLLGLLGLVWIYLGFFFVKSGIQEQDLFQLFWMTPMFFIFGGIVLRVSYQSLRHFDSQSVKHVTGLVVFGLYTTVIAQISPLQDSAWEREMHLLHSATFLIPMLAFYLLYSVVSRKLIKVISENEL